MAAHRPACKAFGYTTDPAMHKYTVSGPSREAVPLAVANSGINSDKAEEFANGSTLKSQVKWDSHQLMLKRSCSCTTMRLTRQWHITFLVGSSCLNVKPVLLL
ncbi:hypothetical protein POM88_045051 [Heracleum sosnowskyi]|uniref:Uncharacterized protein n=1 Tax=Heracleum sosnowskyi TaxID=360622 RepID=A0AAD8H3V8_9APIA|nr:hypothetical protein POM88_045051 [Heracleum sosnowskyi]